MLGGIFYSWNFENIVKICISSTSKSAYFVKIPKKPKILKFATELSKNQVVYPTKKQTQGT